MKTSEIPPLEQRTLGERRPKSRLLGWVVAIVIILAVAGYFLLRTRKPESDSTSGAPSAARGGAGMGAGRGPGRGGRGGGLVPVSTATATTGDMRVYLSALGSVTALNTVTVKSRADGELLKVHFKEGQLVQVGDLLAEIDPRAYQVALEQAQGQLIRDSAVLENARRDLERYRNAQEAVTQQQIDTAASTVAQYTGTVKADQGAVNNYQLQLSYCRVTAPISGRIGLKLVDQGNLVSASSSTGLAVITEEQPIAVVFSIPEDALPAVRKAWDSGNEISVEAFDRSMSTRLTSGKLFAIDNQIDLASGTVRLKAVFQNEDHALFPNQFVNVRMPTEVLKDVVIVPTSSVQIATTSRFVFVVKSDSTVERRNVTVTRSEGERTVIGQGLASGETVVTQGLDSLQNGAKVVVNPAATTTTEKSGPPADGTRRRGQKKAP